MHVCTPLIKSEEEERKLAVYIENNKDYNQTSMCDHPLKQSSIQNIQIFLVKAFHLQPLANDRLQWGTTTISNP